MTDPTIQLDPMRSFGVGDPFFISCLAFHISHSQNSFRFETNNSEFENDPIRRLSRIFSDFYFILAFLASPNEIDFFQWDATTSAVLRHSPILFVIVYSTLVRSAVASGNIFIVITIILNKTNGRNDGKTKPKTFSIE